MGPGGDFFITHQVVVDGTVRAWTTVDDWWNRADVYLSNEPCQILPEISAPMLRDAPDTNDPEDWLPFVSTLLKGANIMHRGRWWLTSTPKTSNRYARVNGLPHPRVLNLEQYASDWLEIEAFGEVIPLRRFSSPDSGRVKWWRKVSKAGQLPPVVLMYFSALESYFIIDGHDRLQARLLERVPPAFVVLNHVQTHEIQVDADHRERVESSVLNQWEAGKMTPSSVDAVNRVLIQLYQTGMTFPTTRGYPIKGGVSAWMSGLEKASTHYAEEAQDEVYELARWLKDV